MRALVRQMHSKRTVVALVGVLAGVMLVAPAAARVRVGPKGLRFYAPPAQLLAGRPGTVIWARSVPTPRAMSAAGSTTLVLYRSVLPNGKQIAVSGLLFVPRGKPPGGGWKMISWAHGTTGIADVCAPSRHLASYYIYPQLDGWLHRGYAVAQTDYQGLGTPGSHEYLVGRAEGAAVDHIALAARQLDPAIGPRFAIAGHSQGGQAALFAAAEAGQYASSLKLVGVAAFAPASHIVEEVEAAAALSTPGGELTTVGGLLLTSAAASSPAIDLHALLTPRAYALLPDVQHECLAQLSKPNSWGGLAPNQVLRTGVDRTALYRVLGGMNPALRIPVPVLLLQGEADTIVFPTFTNQLSTELTHEGDRVDYQTYPGANHDGVVVRGYGPATAWLAERFH
jgi:pimeloyl-ACP methyl ester carboxylesterase